MTPGLARRASVAARHLLGGVLVIAGACTAVFLAMTWLPGDPARQQLALTATRAEVHAEQVRLGLNAPVLVRLGRWFWQLARGNLGHSWTSGEPVTRLLGPALANSAWLVGVTFLVAVPILVAVAVGCGLRPGGLIDRAVLTVGAVTTAVPSFAIGVLLLLIFASKLGWLPSLSSPNPGESMLAQLNLLVLPVAVLGLGLVAYMVQVIRAQVITVASSPFIEAARLRGVGGRRLLVRHILPSVAPVIGQLSAVAVIALVTETVVVEVVFSYPGIGSLLQSAVADQDLPVVQGIALVLATIVIVATGLSNLLTAALTPHRGQVSR